jgi:hypothetical protein
VACFIFDTQEIEKTVDTYSVTLDATDPSDPIPLHQRGLYFSGDDFLHLNQVVLHHTFSLSFWVKIDGDTGNVFSISRDLLTSPSDENYLNLQVAGSGNIQFVYTIGPEVVLD